MSERCPIHARHNHACHVCARIQAERWNQWAATGPNYLNWKDVPAFYESTWPQYRKVVGVVNGEEKLACLDGTETDETVIYKFDHSEEYKKLRERVMLEAMKESPK